MRDLNLMGDASVSGGEYNKIKIMGSSRFSGPVKAESIDIFGSAELEEVESNQVKVLGSARFSGPLQSRFLKITGSARVYGPIRTKEVAVTGELRASDVETEKFTSRGVFDLRSLNANDVEILLEAGSFVGEIGAERVEVVTKGFWHMLQRFLWGHKHELKTDSIEADRIYLERTTAKSVKGHHVELGPGCVIGLIEYRDSISIDKDSRVEQIQKI